MCQEQKFLTWLTAVVATSALVVHTIKRLRIQFAHDPMAQNLHPITPMA